MPRRNLRSSLTINNLKGVSPLPRGWRTPETRVKSTLSRSLGTHGSVGEGIFSSMLVILNGTGCGLVTIQGNIHHRVHVFPTPVLDLRPPPNMLVG